MPLEPDERGVKSLQAGNPVGNDRPPFGDQPRRLAGGIRAVARVTPRRDLGGVLQRQVEPSEIDQEAQVFGVGLAVLAVVVLPARRAREPSGPFVEPDGVGGDSDSLRELANPHPRSKPWSRSNVKSRVPIKGPRSTSDPGQLDDPLGDGRRDASWRGREAVCGSIDTSHIVTI